MAETPRMALEHLCRDYGQARVVDDVSLHIAAGEILCLLGPSGCGKSTTLRISAGVEHQTDGRVIIDGQVVSDGMHHQPPEKRGVGLMFQDFALFPHLTIAQNVAYGLRGGLRRNRSEVAHLLERVNLTGSETRYPHQLSGGEQQRVALVRAMAPRPRIILMDEPFSGLDNRLRDEVRDQTISILREDGASVLLVTHEPGGGDAGRRPDRADARGPDRARRRAVQYL